MKKLLLVLLGVGLLAAKDDAGTKKTKPPFPLGKETTYVTEPLDADGYIDYVAALNERLRRGATPANNANVLLWKAFGPHPERSNMPDDFFKWLGTEPLPEHGDYFISLWHYEKKRLGNDPIFEELQRCSQRPWTAKQNPDLAGWLKANEKPLALVLQASRRTHYYSPLVPKKGNKDAARLQQTLMPGVQTCRELASTLTARAMLHVGEGRFEDAWQDLLTCHRLGRLVARGATAIDLLVGLVIDRFAANADLAFLDHLTWKAERIKDCLLDLQKLPSMSLVADKVDLGERFMFLDSIVMVDRYGSEALESMDGVEPGKAANPIENFFFRVAIDWEPVLRIGNRSFDHLAQALRVKDRDTREKQLDQIVKELDKLNTNPKKSINRKVMGKNIGTIWIGLLIPSLSNVQRARDRGEQLQNNLYLAFALAANRREHDQYPKELDALAPKYLPNVPQDLFSSKPLIYRVAENGYLLYSVGVNGRDEEGRGPHDDPPGDDLSVRMPLPKVTRK